MQAYAVCATFILKGTHFFFQMKDHSILKKEIYLYSMLWYNHNFVQLAY